jgi:two-component system, NtrC family, sensor kinase
VTDSLAARLFGDHTDAEPPTPGILDLTIGTDAARHALIDHLDAALGERRVRVAEGDLLLAAGEDLGGLFVIVEGTIALTRPAGDLEVLHHASSTGPIVGLSSLLAGTRSQFTCRALTPATVIPVSFPELDRLLADPATAGAFVTVLVRSLSRRHQRSVELKAEVEMLNQSLNVERDRLARALAELDAAQAGMVESARMATLGELAAGVAHELSNPVAAMTRAAAHIVDDLIALLRDEIGARQARAGSVDLVAHLERAQRQMALPTAELRSRRRRLVADHGDELAAALIDAGLTDPGEAAAVAALDEPRRGATLRALARAWSLGVSARNLAASSTRVADLVDSLRNYARPDTDPVDGIDVREQLDDTLRLYDTRLDGVDVERRWNGVPAVTGWPAALHQVWANLVANAADALAGAGTLIVAADAPDPGHIRVRVIDDGPGIAPDVLDRIFEPRFTTKAGRVEFGLGLGLSLARQAVARHGGTIDAESRPGRTCMTVVLPVGTDRGGPQP